MIIAAVFWLLTLVVVALFVGRAWSASAPPQARSRTSDTADARPASRAHTQSRVRDRVLSVRSRDQVVRSGVDAVVLLALVRALFPPPGWASWLWVAAVVAVGVGVAGLVARWPRLPASRSRWVTVVYALVGAGLVVVLA